MQFHILLNINGLVSLMFGADVGLHIRYGISTASEFLRLQEHIIEVENVFIKLIR